MKRIFTILLSGLMTFSLFACNGGNKTTKYDVNFYDGETKLKTVKVEEGNKVSRPTDLETKTGYDFVNWFSTPSKNHRFDFETLIKETTNVYAGFSQYQEDTRDWFILGSGTSELLGTSNWGNVRNEEHRLVKASNKNEFSLTLDLLVNDEFQFGGAEWIHKRGYGYLTTDKDNEGTAVFSGAGGGLGETSAKGKNIKVLKDGNYTLTLKTYPKDDTYNTSDPSYTEEKKEVYNLGTYDTISWVYNSEPINVPEVIIDFYIKGNLITKWKDVFNNSTKFTNNEGIYTLSIYLKENDEFLFTSTNTLLGQTAIGSKYLRSTNLDAASKNILDETASKNMVAKADGLYTFTYTASSDVLSAAVDTAYIVPATDYYITGVIGEDSWNQVTATTVNSAYKLQAVAETSNFKLNLTLAQGEQFQIEALKEGSTGRGTWGTQDWNQLGNYNYNFMVPNAAFEPFNASGKNFNIKVLTAGDYVITFDSYAKLITIEDYEARFDIYIKGAGINGWAHGFASDWKFVQNATEKNLYEFTHIFNGGEDFGFELHPEGSNSGYGTYLNQSKLGDAADNANFSDADGGNFVAINAGTYKIVVDMSNAANPVINFYLV